MAVHYPLMLAMILAATAAGDPVVTPACPGEPAVDAQNCDHAISTKGTGTSGRCAGAGGDIRVSASENGQVLRDGGQPPAVGLAGPGDAAARTELAIKTKGTSAQRQTARTELAIKTKGTSAHREAAPATPGVPIDCKDTSVK